MTGRLAELGLSGPYQVHVAPVQLVLDRRAHQVFLGFAVAEVARALRHYPGAFPCWADDQATTVAQLVTADLVVVPAAETENPGGVAGLAWLVDRLLGPGGCPWDQEQTHASLRSCLLGEAYELVEAIESGDTDSLEEELGDVLMQPALHAQMSKRDGGFDLDDVAERVVRKMVSRHPHVFGDATAADSETVLAQWDAIKKAEKPERGVLEGVPAAAPALALALEVSERAARVGFEWTNLEGVWEKFREEAEELREATEGKDPAAIADELGDLLFTVVNLARWLKVDPELALRAMVARFRKRFGRMEGAASAPLDQLTPAEWDALWNKAKAQG